VQLSRAVRSSGVLWRRAVLRGRRVHGGHSLLGRLGLLWAGLLWAGLRWAGLRRVGLFWIGLFWGGQVVASRDDADLDQVGGRHGGGHGEGG
jgi:hypothetical protein